MADVLLFQTPDDGDIEAVNGTLTTTEGLETAVYLSLFGGNATDDGSEGNPAQWWGNEGEDADARMVSRTQFLLDGGLPPSSANLKRVQDAAETDLAWSQADDLNVEASLISANRVALRIVMLGQTFEFKEEWKA